MSDAPVPLDLRRFAEMIVGAREFLRMWARPDGRVACFVNPVPVGPDPADFGATLVDAVEQAAAAYAQAVRISADEARARLWQGIDAARGGSARLPLHSSQQDSA